MVYTFNKRWDRGRGAISAVKWAILPKNAPQRVVVVLPLEVSITLVEQFKLRCGTFQSIGLNSQAVRIFEELVKGHIAGAFLL